MFLLVVVGRALLRVGEDLVGLVDLLEFLGGERIVGVEIGVIHLDELFIGRLDLLLRGVLLYAEDLIVILLFCHDVS